MGSVYMEGGSALVVRKEDIEEDDRLMVCRARFRLLSISWFKCQSDALQLRLLRRTVSLFLALAKISSALTDMVA